MEVLGYIIILLLLAAVGYGVYFFVLSDADRKNVNKNIKKAEKQVKAEAKKAEKKIKKIK